MTKKQKITYYILLVITSATFLFSSYSKLASNPQAIAGFASAGLPIWFMYFIGWAEALGAIGLWIPKLRKWAASGLFVILLGAVIVTVIYDSLLLALFPFVVSLILASVIALGNKLPA